MIRALLYRPGGALESQEGVAAAGACLERWQNGAEHVWLDFESPDAGETQLLRERLGFDELSIDDAVGPEHPPKLEEVGPMGDRPAYLLVVARAPVPADLERSENVALLMRARLVVTVHADAARCVGRARARVSRDPARTIARGVELVAHAVLDEVVSSYDPLLDELDRRIDELEEEIIDEKPEGDFEKILRLRRAIAEVIREARPMRDIALSLSREGHPLIRATARTAFRDLYDHMVRIHDVLESFRESVASIRDAHFAIVNNRMNDVIKTLTVVAVISGTLAVVTGVFGMNFAQIPGAHSPAGFWITVAGMLALALVILALFRWKRWV